MKIIDSRHEWPFPAIHDASAEPDTWVRISDEHADDLLNALPPIYINGGFMVGEPARHDDDGYPVHTAIINVGDGHLARDYSIQDRQAARFDALQVLHGVER